MKTNSMILWDCGNLNAWHLVRPVFWHSDIFTWHFLEYQNCGTQRKTGIHKARLKVLAILCFCKNQLTFMSVGNGKNIFQTFIDVTDFVSSSWCLGPPVQPNNHFSFFFIPLLTPCSSRITNSSKANDFSIITLFLPQKQQAQFVLSIFTSTFF